MCSKKNLIIFEYIFIVNNINNENSQIDLLLLPFPSYNFDDFFFIYRVIINKQVHYYNLYIV